MTSRSRLEEALEENRKEKVRLIVELKNTLEASRAETAQLESLLELHSPLNAAADVIQERYPELDGEGARRLQ